MKTALIAVCAVALVVLACCAGGFLLRGNVVVWEDRDCFGEPSEIRHYELTGDFHDLVVEARKEVHRLSGREDQVSAKEYEATVYPEGGCITATFILEKDNVFGKAYTERPFDLIPSRGKIGVQVILYDGYDCPDFSFLRGSRPVFVKTGEGSDLSATSGKGG